MFDEAQAYVRVNLGKRVTAETHPENQGPVEPPPPKMPLGKTLKAAVLGGLVGFFLGAAGFSSAFAGGDWIDVLSLAPLLLGLAALAAGWAGAQYWLANEDDET